MDPFQRAPENQVPPLVGRDTVADDAALTGAVHALAGPDAPAVLESLGALGVLAGSEEAREHGVLANQNPPVLRTADRYGRRVDDVEHHPSWHWVLRHGVEHGLAGAAWAAPGPRPHLRRAAGYVAWTHVEPGHACPMTMTYAAVPALRADDGLAARWVPGLTSSVYEPGAAVPSAKAGLLAGMGMTEKQGGSDVRATVTVAEPVGDPAGDGEHVLRGHKWFTSAPTDDVLLVLAQAPDGLGCFVVPRVLEDGTRNPLAIVRLKDKLGNRSNASAELELDGTRATRLGPGGRGVRTILEMVAATRLDCVLGSAALMRRAVAEASWHAAHRSAFGRLLADQPVMQNVLADLAVESEAATLLGLRLAASVDAPDDPHERALRRIGLPLAKFWVCKRTPMHVAEALECLGGNGYVEESGMPLLFRESPLNSVWEGSGSVNALDVLRALRREPGCLDAWIGEVGRAHGADRRLDAAVGSVLGALGELGDEGVARVVAARMAACLQGALLVQHAPPEVADAFCASRLGGDWAASSARSPPVSTSRASRAGPRRRPERVVRSDRGLPGPRHLHASRGTFTTVRARIPGDPGIRARSRP